jgi:hypothetical protein
MEWTIVALNLLYAVLGVALLARAHEFDPRIWASVEAVAPRVRGWRHP